MNKHFRRRRAPYGFSFLGVKETEKLTKMARSSQELLSANNFKRVMPPTFDYPETFSNYDAGDSFSTRDHLGEDLAIRNDVTVQLIKGFANLLDLSPDENDHRFYYTVPVFHDVTRSYPAAREVFQLGCEIIGSEAQTSIPELLQLALKISSILTNSPLRLLVGDVRVAETLIHTIRPDLQGELRKEIIARNAVAMAEILSECGWPQETAVAFCRVMLFRPDDAATLFTRLDQLPGVPESVSIALRNAWDRIKPVLLNLAKAEWEPLLLRESRYYSGLIFEGYYPGVIRPPIRGGSYDTLVAEYSSNNLPASGFAIDLSSMLPIGK